MRNLITSGRAVFCHASAAPYAMIFFFFISSFLGYGQTSDYFEMPVKEGYVHRDSVKLYYRVVGSGKDTIMVLHGGPGLHLNYLDADLRPLALTHTLIYYDQRNAGRSTLVTDTTKLKIRDYVADLEAIRQHFRIDRINLIGHSWGGFLAAQYALQFPEKMRSLLLVDPGPPPAYQPYFDSFDPTKRLDSLRLKKMEKAQEGWADSENPYKNCWDFFGEFGRAYTYNPDYIRQAWGGICNAPQDVLTSKLRSYVMADLGQDYDFRKELEELDLPVLILYGEKDPVPFGGIKQWNNSFKNSRLEVIKKAGHFAYFEQPEVFFSLVESFIEDPNDLARQPATWPVAIADTKKEYAQLWSEISNANKRLEMALESGNAKLGAENYTKNAIFLIPTAPPLKGHPQIEAFIKDSYNKGVRSAKFQTLDLEGTGIMLSEAGRYTLRDKDGNILDMGKYLVVWKKVDGKWKAHRDMFNTTMGRPSELYEYDSAELIN